MVSRLLLMLDVVVIQMVLLSYCGHYCQLHILDHYLDHRRVLDMNRAIFFLFLCFSHVTIDSAMIFCMKIILIVQKWDFYL